MSNNAIAKRLIKKVSFSETADQEDQLAVEEPLEIQVAYYEAGLRTKKSISVTMRTPGNDAELAVGFLFTEGIITESSQVASAASSVLDENQVVVTLENSFEPALNTLERNFYTTSSCGVCGKASIDAIKTTSFYKNENSEISFGKDTIFRLSTALAGQQKVFDSTGGLHASSLFDRQGNLLRLREDVGRHNALDKLIGAAFLANQLPLNEQILLLSGRISFELVQKSVMAGIQAIAGIGAPSSLAVELAEENGITLIGFLKKDKFNIYTGSHRITGL